MGIILDVLGTWFMKEKLNGPHHLTVNKKTLAQGVAHDLNDGFPSSYDHIKSIPLEISPTEWDAPAPV